MISNSLKNTIDQHMKMLPHDVQEAIYGSSWERKILDIGRRYGLHVDQLEVLQTELSLAVLGLVGRDEFVKETVREGGISRQVMDLMILDINREIFEPIRNHLKQTRTREETLEAVSQENTTSGLLSHEEQELQKHGVSFNLNDEQETSSASLPFQTMELQKEDEKKPKSVLATPLTLPTKKNSGSSISFEESIKTNIQPKKEVVEPPQNLTGELPQTQTEQAIQGVDLDPRSLPGAKTQKNQNTISDSRGTFYGGVDPYREPVT